MQKQIEDDQKYFEFELYYVHKLKKQVLEYEDCCVISIKDVTNLVKSQKQMSDAIY